MIKITETMKTNKLFDLAYKLYPVSPGGYFCGEMADDNEARRHAYVRGYLDGARCFVDEITKGCDEKGGE